ncbi:TPA: hypothetical protein DEW47_03525 [Patescibacteria group bacterium]|nr:MAG: hypothetical protein UT71_C0001G0043 [Parcubacteria group bacterium GW2011_GWF2_40_10]KKR47873.1 MAG: hypothetical protein UT83_C0002G0004 [Parcubacteria group bacterium GW2011_GWA2_40_143]KKR60321.1 MAG: hypothetical protein UT97_C0002G0021 [Parcubacteria group bacterium GW2011_GWC2_40_31]KKR75327.1 MAG: hypothetical protein UU18_C0008G0017 [Parcubacteria group bacterium GW2011_GWB2_40_8]KKR77531.1 MAG: hypothetical protein UU20_C0005G0005 [Parcubacteria group bacterium GW2011_GWE2_40_
MDNIRKEFDYCADDLSAFKKRIMYRIYCIWFLRSAYSKMALFALFFIVSSLYISFPSVIKNAMLSGVSFGEIFGFLFSNFLIADLVAKFFAVIIAFTAGYAAWDVAKKIKYSHIPTIATRFIGGRRVAEVN